MINFDFTTVVSVKMQYHNKSFIHPLFQNAREEWNSKSVAVDARPHVLIQTLSVHLSVCEVATVPGTLLSYITENVSHRTSVLKYQVGNFTWFIDCITISSGNHAFQDLKVTKSFNNPPPPPQSVRVDKSGRHVG